MNGELVAAGANKMLPATPILYNRMVERIERRNILSAPKAVHGGKWAYLSGE